MGANSAKKEKNVMPRLVLAMFDNYRADRNFKDEIYERMIQDLEKEAIRLNSLLDQYEPQVFYQKLTEPRKTLA